MSFRPDLVSCWTFRVEPGTGLRILLLHRARTWNDSDGKTVHEYWTIDAMGHAWSGGYWLGSFADPRGPSATRAMYSFFSQSR